MTRRKRKSAFWGEGLVDFFEAWTRPGERLQKFHRSLGEVWAARGLLVAFIVMWILNLINLFFSASKNAMFDSVFRLNGGLILVFMIWWIVAFFRTRHKVLAIDFLMCPECRYPLAPAVDGIGVHCPECGFTGDREEVRGGWEVKYCFHFRSAPPIAGQDKGDD